VSTTVPSQARGRHHAPARPFLPEPPSDTERTSYRERNRAYLGAALFSANLSILFCQLGFEIFASPWLFPITILLVLQLVSASMVMFAGSDFDITEHEAVTRSVIQNPM
jgi:hypothetical protein